MKYYEIVQTNLRNEIIGRFGAFYAISDPQLVETLCRLRNVYPVTFKFRVMLCQEVNA